MIELIIAILILVISYLLLVKNFELGVKLLLVLSVLLHKEVFSIYRWDFLPVRFFMLALLFYALSRLIIWFYKTKDVEKISNFIRDPFVLLTVGIWLVRAVSIINSKNITASVMLLGFYTSIVILGFLLYLKYKDESERVLNFIHLYIVIASGLCLFGLVQLYLYYNHQFIIGALWNVPGHIPRVGSTFWDVNHFGAMLAALLPVLGVSILEKRPLVDRILKIGMFFLMTAILFLTSSRTAWIVAFVSFVVFLSLLLFKRLGKKGVMLLLLTFTLIIIPLFVEYSDKSSPFRAKVKDNFHYRIDSFASHLMLLQGSYQIFEDRPILGGGYGSFFEHFRKTDIAAEFFGRDPAALTTRVPPHTIWGENLAETGVLGLFLFVLFVLLTSLVLLFGYLKETDRYISFRLNAMFSAFVGLLMAGIFYSYNSEFFWLIYFLYFIYGVSIISKKYSYDDVVDYFAKQGTIYFIILAVASFFMIFIGLGKNHLIPWDEAIYAKISKNMVMTGEYIDMYWKTGSIWFEKPPLYMWAMSFFMNLIGFSSLAARLPSAIAGFLTILLTYSLAKKYFGTLTAYFSGLSLLLGIHFLYYSRTAMIDVTTAFFITLSLYLYFVAYNSNKRIYWVLIGFVLGLATMTKGVIGLLPLFVICLHEFLQAPQIFKLLKTPKYYYLLLSFFSVALPWHLIMYWRYGFEFINSYFIYHVFSRATMAIEDKGQPWYWYLIVMKVSMRIWFVPLVFGLPFFLRQTFKKNAAFSIITIWFLTVLIVFSSASSKIVWYIVPIYPAAAIISGYFVAHFYEYLKAIFSFLKSSSMHFLYASTVTVFAMTYFFYYRNMVYTGDLTGDIATLLEIKDQKVGKDALLYIDRVELPLVMYYTDGPFNVLDIDVSKSKLPVPVYEKRVYIMAKKGRYSEEKAYGSKLPKVIDELGDYILWYYESDMDADKARLKEIDTLLKTTSVINNAEKTKLENERLQITSRISMFE